MWELGKGESDSAFSDGTDILLQSRLALNVHLLPSVIFVVLRVRVRDEGLGSGKCEPLCASPGRVLGLNG